MALILGAIAALLAVYVLNGGLTAVINYWGHVLGISIETELRRRAFDHLQKLSFRFFDNQKTGHLVSRLTTDLVDVGEVAHHGPEDLIIALLTFLGAFALMVQISLPLALVAALVVPLSEREQVVLRYLSSRLSAGEIADELYVSLNTVKTHIKSIYRKLDTNRRWDAVKRARQLQLL